MKMAGEQMVAWEWRRVWENSN